MARYVRTGRLPLLLAVLFALPARANASLISVDTSFGTNSATLDSATNLEWLNLTFSKNLSYNATTALLPTTFSGWRFATSAEMNTLLADANLVPTSVAGATAVANFPYANTFLSLFGVLNSNSLRKVSIGMFGEPVDFGPSGLFATTYSIESRTNGGVDTLGLVYQGFFGVTNANRMTGSFLVRQGPAPSPVPEPASLVLFGTGLLGASVRRWQRRVR